MSVQRDGEERRLPSVTARVSNVRSQRTIPSQVHAHQTSKADESMAHESDTATLRSGAEEGNLDVVGAKSLGIRQHGLPGSMATGVLVVLDRGEMGAEGSVCLDNASPSDLQDRDE